MAETGDLYPKKNADGYCGWRCEADFLEVSGFLLTERHPSSITVSDGAIDFSYTVGGKNVTRSYALERSDGKITAFTNPDGTRTEVLHNG